MATKWVVVGVLLVVGGLAASVSASRTEEEMSSLFEEWLQNNPRPYNSDVHEKNLRYEIFKSNLNIIDEHNAMESSYKLGLNDFADLTLTEFKNKYLGNLISSDMETTSFRYADFTPPASIDWRTKGAVTPIKNQKQCGSCWAFSTIGAVEGMVQIKTGKLVSLSEQELVSCDKGNFTEGGLHNNGCNGGWMYPSFYWIMKNGVNSEASYPYTAKDDHCMKQKLKTSAASIDGREKVPANNETALQQAVANQPVSVSIAAESQKFQFYKSGILSATGACGTNLDHAVVVVGYGTTSSGEDYWILKNSWGLPWGEDGYIRFKRNIPSSRGMCGIAMDPCYPTKD